MTNVTDSMARFWEMYLDGGGSVSALRECADQPYAMRHLVEFMSGIKEQKKAAEELQKAVKAGIQREGENTFHFIDPGTSLATLWDVQTAFETGLLAGKTPQSDAHRVHRWAQKSEEPQERVIRIPVQHSFGKTLEQQKLLLHDDEKVASTRIIVAFFAVNRLLGNKRIYPDHQFRSEDEFFCGGVTHVNDDHSGARVEPEGGGGAFSFVGIAAVKKS